MFKLVFVQRERFRVRIILERVSETQALEAVPPVTEGGEESDVEKASACHAEAGERTQATEVWQSLGTMVI